MSDDKKVLANRKNALKSTGPKTRDGKRRSSLNAIKHGLRASCLAVPILEKAEDWEAHRERTLRDLAPVGYLETLLAERAAALLWRLARVVRYESEVVSVAIERAEDGQQEADILKSVVDLKSLQARFQEAQRNESTLNRIFGLQSEANISPEEAVFVLATVAETLEVDLEDEDLNLEIPGFPPDMYWQDFGGWTRGMVEEGTRRIRAHAQPEFANVDPWTTAATSLNSEVAITRSSYEERRQQVERERREHLLAPRETVETLTRYETTLERCFLRTLHELDRLQSSKATAKAPKAEKSAIENRPPPS
jgi:hypothetical protein